MGEVTAGIIIVGDGTRLRVATQGWVRGNADGHLAHVFSLPARAFARAEGLAWEREQTREQVS